MRHLLRSLVQAVALVVLVLLGAEAGLWIFHQGAFGEPNFYESDETLGLRLIPNSKMRLSYLGVTPYTEVHINDLGFRGGPHPAPGEDDVVVVGDSLTFGLGVNNDQTYPVLLQQLMGGNSTVINYGVPAYRMHEMTLSLERILQEREPRRVVYAISVGRFLGRLPEAFSGRINFDNGWLIAGKTGNIQVPLPLPGFMMRHSHIVNLIRQNMRDPPREEFTRKIVQMRRMELHKSGINAKKERSRMESSQWFELMGSDGSPRSWSRLMAHLRDLKKVMAGRESSLTLLILPQDFVLHAEAWEKYGVKPTDMSVVQFLIEDLAASALALGFDVLDASSAIQAAGPTTTLPRDWHFSPLGHRVVAQALAEHFVQKSSGNQENAVKLPSGGGVF
jgi:hypothetical protein